MKVIHCNRLYPVSTTTTTTTMVATTRKSSTSLLSWRMWFVSSSSSLLFLLMVVQKMVVPVSGMAYQIVDSGKPKCVLAELPAHTYVQIHYDAPDIIVGDHDEVEDGDENNKKKKKDGPGPTYITILERPLPTVLDMENEEDGDGDDEVIKRRLKRKQEINKNPPSSTELKEKVGIINHKVRQDSQINICIRASMAGSKNPMRFALRIEELSEEEVEEIDTPDVDGHLSFMESQLNHIEHLMHAMIKNADMAKEIDAVHHKHTDALYKATIFWPFLHVGILLVTSFTQVNHIVRFFKSRRII